MPLNALSLQPISELSLAIRQGALSPVELVDCCLARIERLDPQVHAFLTVTAERARADARRAEEEISHGIHRGPLHGIPLALKDLIDVAGVPTTAGSRILHDHIPSQDATLTSRLAAAGAILLGKLTLHEFAMGTPFLDDPIPPARNPWDLDRVPGGSSSGSAAALVTGLCAGSFGSDTGGSIRHPAALSGLVGLKPTFGLVSRTGVIPLAWSLDHVGPMARSVADVALLLQAVAGYDATDPASARVPIPNYAKELTGIVRGIRIGVPETFIRSVADLQPEITNAFENALDVLRRLGATTTPVEFTNVEHAQAILYPILLSEALAYHESWLRTRRDEYMRGFIRRLLLGLSFSGADYVQAQRGRALLSRGFDQVLEQVDLIATPTTSETAYPFESPDGNPRPPRAGFTALANLTGQPSISIPCGFDRRGLPIGLLLSGRLFDEVTLLRVAEAYERATPWHTQHPKWVV